MRCCHPRAWQGSAASGPQRQIEALERRTWIVGITLRSVSTQRRMCTSSNSQQGAQGGLPGLSSTAASCHVKFLSGSTARDGAQSGEPRELTKLRVTNGHLVHGNSYETRVCAIQRNRHDMKTLAEASVSSGCTLVAPQADHVLECRGGQRSDEGQGLNQSDGRIFLHAANDRLTSLSRWNR